MCCKLVEYRRCFFVRFAPTARRDLADFFWLRSSIAWGCYRADPFRIRCRSVADPLLIRAGVSRIDSKRECPLTSKREPYAVALGNLILHEPESDS